MSHWPTAHAAVWAGVCCLYILAYSCSHAISDLTTKGLYKHCCLEPPKPPLSALHPSEWGGMVPNWGYSFDYNIHNLQSYWPRRETEHSAVSMEPKIFFQHKMCRQPIGAEHRSTQQDLNKWIMSAALGKETRDSKTNLDTSGTVW